MTIFTSPSWVPPLALNPPNSISINDFMLNETYGRYPLNQSKPPFVCGLTGKTYSALEVKCRVEALAKTLSYQLGWNPREGSEWDKVVAVFSQNTIDTMTVIWATHRISGIATPANAAYSVPELAHQLRSSSAKVLFTNASVLSIALKASEEAGLPRDRIFLLDTGTGEQSSMFKTVDDLIKRSVSLPDLLPLQWSQGQGSRQVALLCYSSGTSGLPKGVKITHENVINNILQLQAYEKSTRDLARETVLGMLPQSHIYGLVVICHARIYCGDGVINLPRFDMEWLLKAVERHKITTLFLVPPIIIRLVNNERHMRQYDLSSVKTVLTGAAPLGKETALALQRQHPGWKVLQGYGLTETCTVVSTTSPADQWLGSSGSLLPGMEARLVTPDGEEIDDYNTPGELLIRSKSNAMGYFNNEKATNETFVGGWLKTGDEALFRKTPEGNDHIFIVDRIKELIKVNGHQVAPAELEAHLLSHDDVADVAVIGVPDDAAGEIPMAFVVKSTVHNGRNDATLTNILHNHVESAKARYKWLKGGIQFVDSVPKSPSGKILRRVLRDRVAREKTAGTNAVASPQPKL